MQVISSYRFIADRSVYAIASAVETECVDRDSDGAVERAQGSVARTAEMMGRLVELLHESGALSDDAVLKLLGGSYEKAGD
jgi:hypothetical protein